MEPFLVSLLFLCSILFIYILFTKFQSKKTLVNGKYLELPPGSKGWPIVGEMLHYVYHTYNGAGEKFVEIRKKLYSAKVFKTSLMGETTAVLCGREGNKFLFSNENKYVRQWIPPHIHRLIPIPNKENAPLRFRTMITTFLKIDVLRKSVALIDSVMKQHLQSDWSGPKVQVKAMAKKYTSTVSCKLFLSLDDGKMSAEFKRLVDIIDTGILSFPINLPGTNFNRALKASKAIIIEIGKMVKQRRIDIAEKGSSAVQQDVITHLLMTTDENGQLLSEYDISCYILGMLDAAYTNLYNAIILVMTHLTELPDVYDRVLKEQLEIAESKEPNELLTWDDMTRMKYTWSVACEVLRLFSSFGMFREAMTNFEYAGYLIPKGWKLHWVARSIHKNPEYFKDPEKFDPSRFEGNGPAPYTFIPFGGGPRMCTGVEYSRLALLAFIHNVVVKYRWEKVIPSEKIIDHIIPSPAYGLPIHLHPLK